MEKKFKLLVANVNFKNLAFALFGSALIAFGTNMLAVADIPEGGIIGICLIIEKVWGISSSISNLIINGLFCLLAWRLMGTRYMLNAAVATLGFSGFYAIFHAFVPPFIDAKYWLLSAVIGTVIIEIGTGIALRFGSAPSGDHALSMAFVRKGGFDFGWVNFLRDFVVILASVCYANLYSVTYALIIMTLTAPITEAIVKARKKTDITKRISRTKKGWLSRVAIGLIVSVVIGASAIFLYDVDYANNEAIDAYVVEGVVETVVDEGIVAYAPQNSEDIKAGLVFYPGARVEFSSYEPLLKKCAEQGILCVIIEMPYNIAFFGINRASKIPAMFPEVDNWYIGGHSLGGSMAAACVANHPDMFNGVILLASYAINDISSYDVLSVYGNRDGVMDLSSYRKNIDNLPTKCYETVIMGGNHSYFGMYHNDEEAANATISNIEQIEQTVLAIVEFINK